MFTPVSVLLGVFFVASPWHTFNPILVVLGLHKGVIQCRSTRSGIFFLNKANNSCTGHCFIAGFSCEPPPVFFHPSSLDLQCFALTAARGHSRSHPLTKGALISIQYYLTPSSTDSYQPARL